MNLDENFAKLPKVLCEKFEGAKYRCSRDCEFCETNYSNFSDGKRPKVGVGVFIVRKGRVLMGKRKGAHGEGSWSLPGGHLEFNELLEECARREVMEETGLNAGNVRQITFTNDIFKEEGKHYITLFVIAECDSGEPEIMEPDKCEKWDWFSWSELPKPLFIPIQNLIDQGFDLFEEVAQI